MITKDGEDGGEKKSKTADPKKKQEQYQKAIETTATTLVAMSASTDLTINGVKNLQQFVNKATDTTYEVINLGEYKLVKGYC